MRIWKSLKREILSRYKEEEVVSIYIGGGTPTSLDLEELEYLFEIISVFKRNGDIEFTIESNVESLDLDKIKLLKRYGVNRVSLGVQSFQENTLKELNRKHTKEDIFKVIKNLKSERISTTGSPTSESIVNLLEAQQYHLKLLKLF